MGFGGFTVFGLEFFIFELGLSRWLSVLASGGKSWKKRQRSHSGWILSTDARTSSAPASSASLERIFSTFGHVWSKQHNGLGPDKAEKLVKAYRYLHHENEPDW